MRYALLAHGALGQHCKVGHRQYRTLQSKGQALDHANGDTHAGKGARATAEGNGIELLQGDTGVGQQLLDHRQQLLGVQARDHLVMAGNLAVMQQGNGAGFSGGIQGQQGGHRCIQAKEKRAAL